MTGKRGCGHRQIGGMYLIFDGAMGICKRLPIIEPECDCCGRPMKFNRTATQIKPLALLGEHDCEAEDCDCAKKPCFVCHPSDEYAYIMWVGRKFYTTESFIEEAFTMGISKRVSGVPKRIKPGTKFYFMMKNCVTVIENGKKYQKDGLFFASQITRIERCVAVGNADNPDIVQEMKDIEDEFEIETKIIELPDKPKHRGKKTDKSINKNGNDLNGWIR